MSKAQALISAINSTGRVTRDAIEDVFGTSLPMHPDKVITTEFLNQLLAEHGCDPDIRNARAVAVRKTDIQSVSSNCNNFIIEVDWEAGCDMPTSLFLKLPCPELMTRWFCNVIRVWELECRFFLNFRDDFPIRLPKTYAITTRGSRFVLLEENLHADPSVVLHTNPDMLVGPDLAKVHKCLDAFARFHAFYNDRPRQEQEQRLPYHTHPFISPVMKEISRAINKAAIKPCRDGYPDAFPEEAAEMYRLAMAHWDRLLEVWYSGPLSLIHGDSHLGNFFVDGDRMGMIDFQAAQWSKGVRDVQYFLIDSLPIEVLAANEQALVRYYSEQLIRHGVSTSFEEVWDQYRGFSFQTLMTIVVSLGLGSLTEGDALMEEITRRAVAACERVDFHGWLEGRVIGSNS